jgi:hypothetical protein
MICWPVSVRVGNVKKNTDRLLPFSEAVQYVGGTEMTQEYRPGQIVPQSGVYTITHDPMHANMPHEVTVIKGRRFPTCRHCKGISFQLAHAAKHVSEIDHFEEADRLAE